VRRRLHASHPDVAANHRQAFARFALRQSGSASRARLAAERLARHPRVRRPWRGGARIRQQRELRLDRPADTRFTPAELGVARSNYGLQAIDQNGAVAFQEAWSDVLAVSGIESIEAARTYTAVFLGPAALLIKKGWWNAPAFALVDNDPTRK
jgi:hypothetical protein